MKIRPVLVLLLSLGAAPGCSLLTLSRLAHAPQDYAIATQGPESTRAAQEILDAGGNLFDAAIAASFAISVERPHSTGIGGGGFWLSHDASTGTVTALDFRERAPSGIRLPKELLKSNPESVTQLLQDSPLGGGVPGFIAGMEEAHRRWGKLPWKQLLQPAIRLADKGFLVYPDLAEALADRQSVLARDPDARKIFLREDGSPRQLGERLTQKDLARTLQLIADEGALTFYDGALSQRMLAWLSRNGSPLAAEDLRNYKVIERKPMSIDAFSRSIAIMPPPSSGGILLPQMLRLLEPEQADLRQWGVGGERSIHHLAQAMQLAYADRARYLGDPDFTTIPQKILVSREYLAQRRTMSFGERAVPAAKLHRLSPSQWKTLEKKFRESSDTTHLSLIDRSGNAIATTQSINGWMGSGQVIGGTGIVLNNTMDDFSIAEGVKNLYGAIGAKPNRLEPGKTPLSSMTPTLVFEQSGDQRPIMAIGAPGGTRIITCILQTLLNRWVHGMPLKDAIAAPRIHQQWMPDLLLLEEPAPGPGFSKEVADSLVSRGHPVKRDEVHCRVLAVERHEDRFQAAADPRDIGLAIVR